MPMPQKCQELTFKVLPLMAVMFDIGITNIDREFNFSENKDMKN